VFAFLHNVLMFDGDAPVDGRGVRDRFADPQPATGSSIVRGFTIGAKERGRTGRRRSMKISIVRVGGGVPEANFYPDDIDTIISSGYKYGRELHGLPRIPADRRRQRGGSGLGSAR
jgi:hypothetical protein